MSIAAPPVAPMITEFTRTIDSITLVWIRLTPDIALGIVTNYIITYRGQHIVTKKQETPERDYVLIVSGSTNRAVIGNLDQSLTYTVELGASTTAGNGMKTDPVIIKGEGEIGMECLSNLGVTTLQS